MADPLTPPPDPTPQDEGTKRIRDFAVGELQRVIGWNRPPDVREELTEALDECWHRSEWSYTTPDKAADLLLTALSARGLEVAPTPSATPSDHKRRHPFDRLVETMRAWLPTLETTGEVPFQAASELRAALDAVDGRVARADREAAPRPVRTVAGMPWPARCWDCGVTTQDPDAYFVPDDYDDELLSEGQRCPVTGGAHRADRRVREAAHRLALLEETLRRFVREYDEDSRRAPSFVTIDLARAALGVGEAAHREPCPECGEVVVDHAGYCSRFVGAAPTLDRERMAEALFRTRPERDQSGSWDAEAAIVIEAYGAAPTLDPERVARTFATIAGWTWDGLTAKGKESRLAQARRWIEAYEGVARPDPAPTPGDAP